MFDFLGEALRKIGNTFNAEFRDFKRALFSYFKSDSNSNKPEQDKSSEFTSISENDVLLPGSEQDKKDLENHISNIKLLDNPTLPNYDRFIIITTKLLSIEDLYKIEIKGIESTANPYQRMKYKGKSDQHKFYLDNEESFQLISGLEKNDALFEALIEGDPTLTQITSQHKIDLDILHQHKKTIRRSSGSIYGLIQDHPDQNAKLLFAIQHNDLELVDIAIKNGASIKVLTENKNIFSSISSNAELIDYFQNKYLFTSVESPNSNLYDLKKGLSDFWQTQDGNGNILFYLECLHGDEDAIEKLLKIDDNKNKKGKDDLKKELSDFWKTQDENGNTLLHLACSQGNEDAIKELLKVDDIDVGITNNNGEIALELIEDKNLKSSICAIVLEKENLNRHTLALPKSNATLKSKITEKLLGWQTLRKIQNILEPNERPAITVESLLKSHPDSLIFAIRFRGDFANVIDAFKNGASIQTLTRDKNILSSIASNAELIKFLNTEYISSFSESYFGILKKPDDLKKELSDFWKTQDENGNTLLHLACSQGNENAIKELLKVDDIDVGITNNNGKIAFELIKDKSLKSSISDMLLKKQEAFNTKILGAEMIDLLRNEPRETPNLLELALEPILKFTDIDIENKINVLPYASSLKNDVVSFIESALESEISKAEKDVLQTEKKVSESIAIIKDNLEKRVEEQLTFKEKLKNGDLSDKEKLEITQKLLSPFELDEIKLKNKEFFLDFSDDKLKNIESLIQNHPNQNDKLILALKNSDVELAKIALDRGADVNATIIPDYPEYRPIHYVTTITGNVEMTKLLLEKGVNVNALLEGKTCLDGIAKKGNQELINLLESYDAAKTTDNPTYSPSRSPSRTSSSSGDSLTHSR